MHHTSQAGGESSSHARGPLPFRRFAHALLTEAHLSVTQQSSRRTHRSIAPRSVKTHGTLARRPELKIYCIFTCCFPRFYQRAPRHNQSQNHSSHHNQLKSSRYACMRRQSRQRRSSPPWCPRPSRASRGQRAARGARQSGLRGHQGCASCSRAQGQRPPTQRAQTGQTRTSS